MRYKIVYGKGPKTDKWGHYLPEQPPSFEEFMETLAEAEEKARVISCKHKKYCVNVYDLKGPQFRGSTLWCVYGFEKGRRIDINDDYFKALDNPAVMESWY